MGDIFKVDCAGQFPFTATLTASSFCSHIIFLSIFFFIINGPGYLSQYSDYAYGLGGRVIGGRFPEEPKTFFASIPDKI